MYEALARGGDILIVRRQLADFQRPLRALALIAADTRAKWWQASVGAHVQGIYIYREREREAARLS